MGGVEGERGEGEGSGGGLHQGGPARVQPVKVSSQVDDLLYIPLNPTSALPVNSHSCDMTYDQAPCQRHHVTRYA